MAVLGAATHDFARTRKSRRLSARASPRNGLHLPPRSVYFHQRLSITLRPKGSGRQQATLDIRQEMPHRRRFQIPALGLLVETAKLHGGGGLRHRLEGGNFAR
jgi:hypothetical protein